MYRARRGTDGAAVKLAAVVQRMVPAEAAGVLFTANPVTGARGQLTIDASPGLGEAVVEGLVTPDHFVVDKRRWRVREKRVGRREIIIQARAGGGVEEISPSPYTTSQFALPLGEVRKLARIGCAIERHFAGPQDIEWAWTTGRSKQGEFQVLQARPMTALPDPIRISAAMKRIVPMLAEMWPTRPYPLDMTTFTGVLERAIGGLLGVLIGKSAPDPGRSLVEEDGVVVRFEPSRIHPTLDMLIAPWRTLWRTRGRDPARWREDPGLEDLVSRARELENRDFHSLSWRDNLGALEEALALVPCAMQPREIYLPRALFSLGALWVLLALAGRRNRMGALLDGVETKTTETNRALEQLAGTIRAEPMLRDVFARAEPGALQAELGRSREGMDFTDQVAGFLRVYGHREIGLTVSQGTWKDQPETVLAILKVLASNSPATIGSYETWKRTRDELLTGSLLGARPFRARFLAALAGGRALVQIREDTHFFATLALPSVRRIALELGRRLERAGALDAAADVFHLRLEELKALGVPWPPAAGTARLIRECAARRNAKRESLAETPMVDPRLLEADSRAREDEDVLLRGSPGSPGTARGTARIVRSASEFAKLQPGDVLVAPITNPSWTPLFQRAAAIVVDTGGSASHAAIVAREYGVPAVLGTMDGTRRLVDGQQILVDGSRGLVLSAG